MGFRCKINSTLRQNYGFEPRMAIRRLRFGCSIQFIRRYCNLRHKPWISIHGSKTAEKRTVNRGLPIALSPVGGASRGWANVSVMGSAGEPVARNP
jgi:hypothetical protein